MDTIAVGGGRVDCSGQRDRQVPKMVTARGRGLAPQKGPMGWQLQRHWPPVTGHYDHTWGGVSLAHHQGPLERPAHLHTTACKSLFALIQHYNNYNPHLHTDIFHWSK